MNSSGKSNRSSGKRKRANKGYTSDSEQPEALKKLYIQTEEESISGPSSSAKKRNVSTRTSILKIPRQAQIEIPHTPILQLDSIDNERDEVASPKTPVQTFFNRSNEEDGSESVSSESDYNQSDSCSETSEDEIERNLEISDVGLKVRKRSKKKLNVMKAWKNHRESYLDTMLCAECPCDDPSSQLCVECKTELGMSSVQSGEKVEYSNKMDRTTEAPLRKKAIMCEECNLGPVCVSCALKLHGRAPLHFVKEYNGFFWKKTTLQKLGLVVQLGHSNSQCSHPSNPKDITVIDVRGIQCVKVKFCDCALNIGVSQEHRDQFLRHGWFPATVHKPETVATSNVLRLYEKMAFQSKISVYDFYQALTITTDVTGLHLPKTRYKEFLRITRQYRHLKMLKRKGVSLNPGKLSSIKDGDLGIACPACPQPGINIPEDWKTRVDAWIYSLYLMIDANFRLKHKDKGKSRDDTNLGNGWSYFVEEEKYQKHLSEHVNEKEIKYCTSGMRAIDHAHIRGHQDYDVSGIVAIQCKHMLIRKNGVGDLQFGERQGNVDYILLSTLLSLHLARIVLSYDIACQYGVNFQKRVEKYPVEMQTALAAVLVLFVIPKFHLPGHGEKCQTKYSLNVRRHVGRTDGENIERGWAHLNPLAMATKEMAYMARHDTFDEHIDYFNFRRIITFGKELLRKLKEASEEMNKQKVALEEFNSSFSDEVIAMLEKKMDDWEANVETSEDPYREERVRVKSSEVKQELAMLEMKDAKKGRLYEDKLTATHWLCVGLELEELMIGLEVTYSTLKENDSSFRKTAADEKSALTYYRFKIWRELQQKFMHGIEDSEPDSSDSEEVDHGIGRIKDIWKEKLYLPSSLSKEDRDTKCIPGLWEKERALREAQAFDILEEARTMLRKGFILINEKKQNVSGDGQKRNTTMNSAITEVKNARKTVRLRYESARHALMALDPDGDWKKELKELKDEHLVRMGGNETLVPVGKGKHITSWIWTMADVGMTERKQSSKNKRGSDKGGSNSLSEDEDEAGETRKEPVILLKSINCGLDFGRNYQSIFATFCSTN